MKGECGETGPCGPQGNPGVAEKDCTTWTIKAIYDTGVPISPNDSVSIRDNGNVWWHDQSKPPCTISIISPAGALLATLDGEMFFVGAGRVASLLERYILWNEFDDANQVAITVQEGITKLWRRLVNDDRGGYALYVDPLQNSSCGISPSGEWIVTTVKEAVTGNGLVFIYRGS